MGADLRQRTAGPAAARRLTAGGFSRTRRGFVTLAVIGQEGEGGTFAEPGHHGAARGIITCGGCQVTDGAMRTAVQVVLTTHGLQNKPASHVHQSAAKTRQAKASVQ